ncbi:ATPase family protein, partial [Necator americanus]
MVSKNKKRLEERKRKVADRCEDRSIIEIPSQKRRIFGNDEATLVIEGVDKENGFCGEQASAILPTREYVAQQLVIAIRAKQLVVLEGPIGCGKTFLASYAARELNIPLKVMQMGDQVDSKSFFGSYHCSEVAGQFLWKPSSFSQWLSNSCLILLEDIDLANADVVSTVVQLASERSAVLPSGEVVPFHKDVRICVTISGKGKKSGILDGVPVRIELQQLTDDELRRLISKASPRVAHLAKTLVSIFRTIEGAPPTANSRQLTSSDLLRGCARLNKLTDLSSNMAIFTELVDTWCLADPTERSFGLCKKLADHLLITADQVSFHLFLRQPTFSHDERFCTVGRCRLPSSPSLHGSQRHRLGHTRDVLQLMERLAVCVQNREPVLLVGETGVGKTSVVQFLASAVNVTLKVVNLSPYSDADELIS